MPALTPIQLELSEESPEDGVLTENDLSLLKLLDHLYEVSDKVAIKKLSKNDRAWAWRIQEGHQAGFYVPLEFRGPFFPADSEMARREDKPHIYMEEIRARWPAISDEIFTHHYRRFTNKRTEGHLTVPPKKAFSDLSPASFLVLGRTRDENGQTYFECLTVDSNSAVYSLIEARFDLQHAFLAGVFDPPEPDTLPQSLVNELDQLISEFIAATHANTLPQLIAKYRQIPNSSLITKQAQEEWLAKSLANSFNPFSQKSPGNSLMELTTEVEFTIYRRHELRYRASQVLEILFRDGIAPSTQQIVTRIVRHFIPLYEVMRDASQQRRTRVGAGFEAHIKRMLDEGQIPYEEQFVVGTRRPDFVLPVGRMYLENSPDALVLAAKTTLRERWKQVPMEGRSCSIYLATMDEKVTRSAVREMNDKSVLLVVPEAFKAHGTVVEYAKEPNVLTFSEFFTGELMQRRKPIWKAMGIWN